MNVIRRHTTYFTPAPKGGRPINGVCLHHSATTTAVLPHANGSWHYMIGRAGEIFLDVLEGDIAWGVANTNKWRPPWVEPARVAVSDMNWVAIHIELAYAPQDPHFQVPTWEQEDSLRELLADLYRRHGRLPIVGHGEVQSDKWASEPHGLNWGAVGISARGVDGRYLTAPAPAPAPEGPMLTPEQQTILDEAAKRGIVDGAGLAWYVTFFEISDPEIKHLREMLPKAQGERDDALAEVERLHGLVAELQAQPAPSGNVTRIELRATAHLSDGSAVPVPVGVA